MNYQQLSNLINTLTPDQMKMEVNVYDIVTGEYYKAHGFGISSEDNELTADHPFIIIN